MRTWIAGTAVAVAIALPVLYLLLGGASYAPAKAADPCTARTLPTANGAMAVAEQVALSAADGAACTLHVSREDLVLAFRSRADLASFGRSHNLSSDQVDNAIRDGLRRAIADAQRAGQIGSTTAFLLNTAIATLPIDALLRALQGSSLSL
jgi:hypothetical protein